MFPLEILEIRLDFLHVLFNVARRHEVFPCLDAFLLIVYAYQYDGNLGSQGDVIEPFFHSGLAERVPSGVMAR